MTPFDNSAFRSWPLLMAGAILFGILFEAPIILYDLVAEGRIMVTRASMLLGIAGFAGYLCVGVLIKTLCEVSD